MVLLPAKHVNVYTQSVLLDHVRRAGAKTGPLPREFFFGKLNPIHSQDPLVRLEVGRFGVDQQAIEIKKDRLNHVRSLLDIHVLPPSA